MKKNIGQLLALVFAAAMVATIFSGVSGLARTEETAVALDTRDIRAISRDMSLDPARAAMAQAGSGVNALPPGNGPDSVAFAEGFETGTLGDLPDDPPWAATESTSSVATGWGSENFENGTVGQNPNSPYWETHDGASSTTYWGRDMEDTTAAQNLRGGYFYGDMGGFNTFAGDATLVSEAAPAGAPPGTINPGFTRGALSARFNEGTDTGVLSYFGPVGIDPLGTVTHAYAGAQIYFRTTTAQRLDLILYDYNIGANVAIEIMCYNGLLYHFPGGTQTQVTGATWAANSWHELFVEYWETNKTCAIWWDGTKRVTNQAWADNTMTNIDGLIWFGGESGTTPPANADIDNFCHFLPPTGTADAIDVSNAWSYSGTGGAQSVRLDQNAVATPCFTETYWGPPYGYGQADYSWAVRTSTTVANTNGAVFSAMDFNERALMSIRFSGGQIQYNTAGTWTNLQAFAANTEYTIDMGMDCLSKRFTNIAVNGVTIVADAALTNRGAGLSGFRVEGTGGTQSEIYFDEISMSAALQDGTVRVADDFAHAGAQSAHIWEAGADAACDLGAYMGGDLVTYGEFWFWFYGDGTLGGGSVYLMDTTQTYLVSIISLGSDLTATPGVPHPGEINWVDGDGAGGGTVVDGPAFNQGAWNNISIRYDALAKTYEAFWNGASQGTFGFLESGAADAGIVFFFGEGPGAPQDFFYDDVGLWVDDLPAAPTNLHVVMPASVARTDNYYTVDQDNAVQGTVTNTYANIDEISPADGNLEMVTEVSAGGGTTTATYKFTGVTAAAGPHDAYFNDMDDSTPAELTTPNSRTEFTDAYYANLVSSNNVRAGPSADPGNGDEMGTEYRYAITQSAASITQIDLTHEAQYSVAAEVVTCFAWNGVTSAWDTIGTTMTFATAATDYTMNRSITTNPGNYVVGGVVRCVFYPSIRGTASVDYACAVVTYALPTYDSLEHRWRTQNVPAGADYLEFTVRGSHSSASDDAFVFGIATVLAGPYTPYITVNTDSMTTYMVQIPVASGVLYVNVVDSNSVDTAPDTVFIDLISLHWADVSGTSVQNLLTTADNPIRGTVTGAHTLTQSIPGDASAQQIAEVVTSGTTTLINEGFEGAAVPPTGWTSIDQDGDGNNWGLATSPAQSSHTGTYSAFSASYTTVAINPDNYLISPQIDLTGYTASTLTWWDATQDPAWPSEFYEVRVSTTGNAATDFTNMIFSVTLTTDAWTQRTASLTPYVGNMVYIAWRHTASTDWYQMKIDDILLTGDMNGNALTHKWTMQNVPANTLSNTLFMTARTSAAPDETFSVGWSTTLNGVYTNLVTINSAAYATYSACLPTTFSGALYIQVRDNVGGDTLIDSVFIDMLYVRSVISPVNTTVNVLWTLSADDGAGQNDVTAYNVYIADQELGEDMFSMHNYLGSVPAGTNIYRHYGEASDFTNNIWYLVTAEDSHSEGFPTGNASKFNVAPLVTNVAVEGTYWPGISITAGTPNVALEAFASDDTSTWEDIPKMSLAEWYDTTDPGLGAGTAMADDGDLSSTMESFTYSINTAGWPGGTNHRIYVRVRESGPGNTGTGWGAVMSVWINVTGSPVTPYFRIPVALGWNLVSVPLTPATTTMPTVLMDSNFDTYWQRAMWYNPQTPADPWKQYNELWNPALNDLTAVDVTMGVWIYVDTLGDGFINVTGSQPISTAIQLRTGWNLVGFPSDDTTYTVAMLKTDCPTVTMVERFDGAQTYLTTTMLDAEAMAEGRAYWVYTSADTVWNKAW